MYLLFIRIPVLKQVNELAKPETKVTNEKADARTAC
jgi:hypothetical protein